MKKKILVALGFLISIVALILIFRKIDLFSLVEVFDHFHFLWLIPLATIYLFGFLIRGLRWRLMLFPIKPITFFSTTGYIIIGYMANNIFPARLGEFVRAFVIGKREGISKVSSLGSIGIERICDGIVLLIILIITFFLSSFEKSSTDTIKQIIILSSAVFIPLFLLIFLVRYRRSYFKVFVEKIARFFPIKVSSKLIEINSKLLDSLSFLRFDKSMLTFFLLSIFVWINEGLVFWVALRAFNLKASFIIAYFTLAFVNLGLVVPSGPAFIGVFQGLNILAFSYFGINNEISLGYSLIIHSIMIIPITILGLLLINLWGIGSLKSLYKKSIYMKDS